MCGFVLFVSRLSTSRLQQFLQNVSKHSLLYEGYKKIEMKLSVMAWLNLSFHKIGNGFSSMCLEWVEIGMCAKWKPIVSHLCRLEMLFENNFSINVTYSFNEAIINIHGVSIEILKRISFIL